MEEDDDILDPETEAAMFAAARRARSSGGARKMSLAHGDVIKYRRAFDAFDTHKTARIQASDLGRVISKLGYKITQDKIDASIIFFLFSLEQFIIYMYAMECVSSLKKYFEMWRRKLLL